MRKTALAVAVGGLFIAPAAQAQIVFGSETIGTLQLYGKLYPQVIWAESKNPTNTGSSVSNLASPSGVCGTSSATGACTGATAGSRVAVDTQNSYLGFRGERQLGRTGLKGIWQIEQSLEFDTGTGVWSNRNSFLGLSGGFGTVKLGNMDTIYKEYGQAEELFGITSGNFISPSNVLSHIGVGNNNTARFHERAPNSIQYQTPEISGFQAGLQYSPDETKNDVGNQNNRYNLSMGVKWESGPFYASVQHERHKDFFGGSNNVSSTLSNAATAGAHSTDTATRLSGAFRFGNHRIGADVARLKWDEEGQAPGVTKFDDYEHTAFAVSFESKWGGPWRTAFAWVHASEGSCTLTNNASCSTTGVKGDLFDAGLAYDFDRQTFVYALAAVLKNGESARYDNWAASSPARGADIYQFAIGMQYRF
ncbi:MAG TPA: porin [Burkholderiales bacterium]|nr:porin [Burkholderiales bacterium]